jgi:RNA polymerase sigma-70 factor (ECF subfamily)
MDVLAERAARGEKDALEEMARMHYADVFRFCARNLNAQMAEDATQDTFMIAMKQIKRFRGESELRTWLFGIAMNVCRNHRRKLRNSLPLQDWDYLHDEIEDNMINAEVLRNAIAKLDDNHRDVVLLHEMEELTYEECAHILRIPVGTVKSRLYYAFRKLRELIDGENNS